MLETTPASLPAHERLGLPEPSWATRLADPAEPLYTMAVTCDLLGADPHTIRRLDALRPDDAPRSDGNQRRYSRNDIELLGAALMLINQGIPRAAVAAILERDLTIQRLTLEP